MGNTTCKPRGGESLKNYLIRKFSSFSGKKKIDELLQLAVDEEHRFPGQHNVRLTKSQLKTYYAQRDALVDEYADDVIEAELLGMGTYSTTSVTDVENTRAKKKTKQKKKDKKKPGVRSSLAIQKVKSAAVVHASSINRTDAHVRQSTAVVKANALSNAVAPVIGHPCGENTDMYKSSPVINAVASIGNAKKSAGDGRKPQIVKVQPCVEPDGKCFAPHIQTTASVSFTPAKRCGIPTIQSCDRLLPDVPPASSSPALPIYAKEFDQPTSTPAPTREEKALTQSLQSISDRILPSKENDKFDKSNAVNQARGKTPSNDLAHRTQPGCRTRTIESTRITDRRDTIKERKEDIKLELQARAKMFGLDKGIVWPTTLEELTSFDKVYYVGQFLNTQLFKQRVVRKEKGLGSWMNGLTPFQTWVIQHDGTLELEAVLQPPRRRLNHAHAKISCWRGNTPPPPPRPADTR